MKKITLTTLKSFVKHNQANLHIQIAASFDGMSDGLNWNANRSFVPATKQAAHGASTLGIEGVWLVGGSRNYFEAYNDGQFTGIQVSNCCGKFTLAIPAAA